MRKGFGEVKAMNRSTSITDMSLSAEYIPVALYYEDADSVEYVRRDSPCVYRRVDETLTMVLDMGTREAIGFRLKGFKNFYLRKLKPSMEQLDDGNFVFLVNVIERLVAEMGDWHFQQDGERKKAYATAAEMARNDRVELHDFPEAA
jgi:hypothetical protein